MTDVVYAENVSFGVLTPENEPERLQKSFEEEIQQQKMLAQKCSEDSFAIKTALNDLKRVFKEDPKFYDQAIELEKMSIDELRTYKEEQYREREQHKEQNQHSEDSYYSLQIYADQLLLQAENKQLQNSIDTKELSRNLELSRNYGEDFSYLYQMKKQVEDQKKFSTEEENGGMGNVQVSLNVVPMPENSGIMSQAEKLRQDALGGVSSTLALDVQIEGNVPFTISIKPFDERDNETQHKAQLSFSEQAIQQLMSGSEEQNKAKIEQIYKFCSDHGMSTVDMTFPTDREGNIYVDEKLKELMAQVKDKVEEDIRKDEANREQKRENEMKTAGLSVEDTEDLLPAKDEVAEARSVSDQNEPKNDNVLAEQRVADDDVNDLRGHGPHHHGPHGPHGGPTPPPAPAPAPAPATRKSAVDVFSDMVENDLGRQKNRSYFKRRNDSWHVFILYDKDVEYNHPVEKDKKGNIQYHYAVKLYVKEDSDGVVHVSYRTPNGKKLDELYAGAIAGKLKDLNVTHFRIPKGWRADDIGTWRKALAEKGIVPTGISIDHSKAEAMLEAAKKKLSTEAYKKFKYRLGEQMHRYNVEKGKHVTPSEQAFIDGLRNSRIYGAFMDGYSNVLKSEMRRNFRMANGDFSAADKIANFRSLRRLYDVYKMNMGPGCDIYATDPRFLSDDEKNAMRAAGLHGRVIDYTEEQIGTLFKILLPRSREQVEQKLDSALEMLYNPPAGRRRDTRPARTIINQVLTDEKDMCKDIFEDLVANGQDELKLVETVGNMSYDYESRHPTPTTPRTYTPEPVEHVSEQKKTFTQRKQRMSAKNQAIPVNPKGGTSIEM